MTTFARLYIAIKLIRQRLIELILIAAVLLWSAPARAQGQTSWSPPTDIYRAAATEMIAAAADRQGDVHLVWAGLLPDQSRDSALGLLYSRLHDGEWSKPVDILVNADMPQLVAGPDARLHLVFRSAAGLAYSSAPVDAAGNAQSWSPPQPVGYRELVVGEIGLALGAHNTLHVAATDGGSGDVYYFQSPDMGEMWLEPVRVAEAVGNTGGSDVRVAAGSDGTIHVVWATAPYPEGYPPQGVYYAQSADGANWSAPLQLAGVNYGQAAVVADAANNVHVLYSGRVSVGGKYHRWSHDGVEWTEPVAAVAAGTGGLNSVPTLLADATGGVHLLGGTVDNVWYEAWDGANWTAVQDLRTLLPGENDLTDPAFATERATLALAGGNQLHAFFGAYTPEESTLWHTQRTLDLPAQAILPYPTATPPPPAGLRPDAEQDAAATPVQLALDKEHSARAGSAGGIYLALLPALLLVVAVAGVQFARRRR